MPTTVENITQKTEMVELEPKTGEKMKGSEPKIDETEKKEVNCESGSKVTEEDSMNDKVQEEKAMNGEETNSEAKKAEVPVQVEPKTGVSFPVQLDDGMQQLKTVGLRKKSMLGIGIKIYSFGIYADDEKLKDLLKSKIAKVPTKPTKEMFQMVIDSDLGMTVRLVIVFSSLTMNMVRKNFDESLGAAIKKLTGAKNEELTKKIMSEASDGISLTPGSVIEISRIPGCILETKVKGEVVGKVESELLCRAFTYLYLGDDPFDKDAKESFGISLISLLQ